MIGVRPGSETGREDREVALVRLQRARWRVRTAALGGPEWDAATAQLVELEAQLGWGPEPGEPVGPEGSEP